MKCGEPAGMADWLRRAALAALLLTPPGTAWAQATGGDAAPVFVQRGLASYYSDAFQGRTTASGERFRQDRDTAASRTLPLGAKATVINRETGRSVEVTVNDRGPHIDGRIIDLSRQAARRIGIVEDGIAPVRVEADPSAQPTERLKELVARQARRQDECRKRRLQAAAASSPCR